MSNEEGPDRLFISDRGIYDKLMEHSVLKGKKNRVYYMMALAYGWTKGERLELESKEGYVRTSYLKDSDKALIKAIAVAEEDDLSVLTEKDKVYSIADEYAASGVILLEEEVFEKTGSFQKRLEIKLKKKNDDTKEQIK